MKNIQLISASAGSGKTYRLMNDIAKRVSPADGKAAIAPEHIMATTFIINALSFCRFVCIKQAHTNALF